MILAPGLFSGLVTEEEEKTINEACSLFLDLIYNVNKVNRHFKKKRKKKVEEEERKNTPLQTGQCDPVGRTGSRLRKKSPSAVRMGHEQRHPELAHGLLLHLN